MIKPAELVTRLEGVRNTPDGYKAKCPAHDDGHASLTIGTGKDGQTLVHCFAGCAPDAICSALGLKLSDLFAETERKLQRLTVSEMAAHKKLPTAFLRDLGLRDLDTGGIGIPYRGVDGDLVLVKGRVALSAKEGSRWPQGKPLMPYGLERLADARETGSLVLVEGESDCWTLWHHETPALGVPGASSTRVLEASHFQGIEAVYVIREPDKGGDTFIAGVRKRLTDIGFKGAIKEVRLPGAKDPSDLHCQNPNGFKVAFANACDAPNEDAAQPASPAGFKSVKQRLDGEREERLERATRVLSFHNAFLDDALGGVFPNDLVLIGAGSGVGKTGLATIVAHGNAKAGKRVHYLALEAEEREIERRMKFRELSELIYKSEECRHLRAELNYIDWYAGRLERVIDKRIEDQIAAVVAQKFGTMHTLYKRGSFGVEDLKRVLLDIKDDTDIAIVDHLQYVDVDDDNENRGVKGIVMTMRDLSLVLGKPLFVVAHLRKRDRRGQQLVPELEDFHGTSDTPKISTKAIMIAPARDQQSNESHLFPTYIYAPKCRMDGSRTRYCALIHWNARKQSYQDEYVLGRLSFGLDEFEPIPNKEMPTWAKRAIQ